MGQNWRQIWLYLFIHWKDELKDRYYASASRLQAHAFVYSMSSRPPLQRMVAQFSGDLSPWDPTQRNNHPGHIRRCLQIIFRSLLTFLKAHANLIFPRLPCLLTCLMDGWNRQKSQSQYYSPAWSSTLGVNLTRYPYALGWQGEHSFCQYSTRLW